MAAGPTAPDSPPRDSQTTAHAERGDAAAELVYDGDCGFCRYMVDYARSVTGDAVVYRPYQQAAADHPQLSEDAFRESIRLFEHAGVTSGAEASFRTLALGNRTVARRLPLALYRHMPGVGPASEWAYRFVAAHRAGVFRLARVLFGPRLVRFQADSTASLLTRSLFMIALVAIGSLWWQATALFGTQGILPANDFFDQLKVLPQYNFFDAPSLLWWNASNAAIHAVCALGITAATLGAAGRFQATAALVCYASYLSLTTAGQTFTAFQWDALLLESMIVCAIAARRPTWGLWLARLLLFRFMFLAGLAKVLSNDPTWSAGTALNYHFETQPLPTPLAWYAHHLPDFWLHMGTRGTLWLELALPFLLFAPRNLRLAAALAFVGFELLILATGNYNFFNLLTIALCIAALDDERLRTAREWLGRYGTRPEARVVPRPAAHASRSGGTLLLATTLLIGLLGMIQVTHMATGRPASAAGVLSAIQPWHAVNRYGLFAVMTRERFELTIEATTDGETWHAYRLHHKPGDPSQRPGWVAPHHPRVDWQVWFAALGRPEAHPWLLEFVWMLLERRPEALRFVTDPLKGDRPSQIRVLRSRYRFSSPAGRATDGAWWVEGPPSVWLAPVRVRTPVIRHDPLALPD